MLGLATAGRDLGALAFERVAAGEHCMLAGRRVARRGCVAGPDRGVGPRRGGCASVCDHVRRALDGRPNVTVVDRPERTEGRAYYRGFCFKGFASFGGPWVEAADGGAVDWTARLLADRKERLFISGLGVDRIALGGRDAL